MDYLLAILLGALQGITEFLPISSTGHLVIAETWFGVSSKRYGLTFDVALHMGTLLALIWYFRQDLLAIFKQKQMALLVIIGTVPAVLIGVLFEAQVESSLRTTTIVGWALIAVALIMILAERLGKGTATHPSWVQTVVIGIAQAAALIPGVSRSGSTISAGILLGLSRETSARFSFLLAVPIVAGAGAKRLIFNPISIDPGMLVPTALGALAAIFVGYATIAWLLAFLRTRSLYPFVVYRVALGILLLLVR